MIYKGEKPRMNEGVVLQIGKKLYLCVYLWVVCKWGNEIRLGNV